MKKKFPKKYIPLLFSIGIVMGIFLGTLLNFDRNDISLLQENGAKSSRKRGQYERGFCRGRNKLSYN